MIHLIECIRCLCGEQQQYYPTLNQCLIWKYQWKKVSNAIKPRHTKQFRVVFVLFCVLRFALQSKQLYSSTMCQRSISFVLYKSYTHYWKWNTLFRTWSNWIVLFRLKRIPIKYERTVFMNEEKMKKRKNEEKNEKMKKKKTKKAYPKVIKHSWCVQITKIMQ